MRRARDQLALALVLVGGLLVSTWATLSIKGLAEPLETASGIITGLHVARSRGTSSLTLTMSDGQEVHWSCGRSSCEPSVRALKGLAWETPMPAEMQFAAGRLVGLTIREAEVIEPQAEIGRQTGSSAVVAVVGAGAALLSGLGLYIAWRDRPKRRLGRRSARRIAR